MCGGHLQDLCLDSLIGERMLCSIPEAETFIDTLLGMCMPSCKHNVLDFTSKSTITNNSQLEAVRVPRAC